MLNPFLSLLVFFTGLRRETMTLASPTESLPEGQDSPRISTNIVTLE